MPYLIEREQQDRLIGKTIAEIVCKKPGTATFVFTDGSTLQIDACVEHEKVKREINLIVNQSDLL